MLPATSVSELLAVEITSCVITLDLHLFGIFTHNKAAELAVAFQDSTLWADRDSLGPRPTLPISVSSGPPFRFDAHRLSAAAPMVALSVR
jgi:hypothetical protein